MNADDIVELFAAFGRVSVRRLFGGFGIYVDGVMFALASRGVIYLKADDDSAAAFRREGSGPFTYGAKGGQRTIMSYWRLPDRLYDDPDELAAWARTALSVARRAQVPRVKAAPVRRPARRTARAQPRRGSRRG
jgi:DNA transformation protein and related proteins